MIRIRRIRKHAAPADPDDQHCCKRLPHLNLTALDVGGEVNLLGQLCDVHLEPLLHLVQDLGVRLLRHESDGQALPQEQDEVFLIIFYSELVVDRVRIHFRKNGKY